MTDGPLDIKENWHEEAPDAPKTYQGSPEMVGDSEIITLKDLKCDHFFVRKNATEFSCKNCLSGWIDGGKFTVKDGKIIL